MKLQRYIKKQILKITQKILRNQSQVAHSFHLVDESPWPLYASTTALGLTVGLVNWFHTLDIKLMFLSIARLILTASLWWKDVSLEGSGQGFHTSIVNLGLRWGIVLFIVSEIFFFLRFFWAFFHRRLSPTVEIGNYWPPIGIITFNPFEVPFLNTLVLLRSGVTVTWAHHRVIRGNRKEGKLGLIITIILGVYFTALQALEYAEASFSIADSAYGSTFFIATGFHGLHVLVGTLFLLVCLFRIIKYHFSSIHHFGLEAAAWYWHFVDVVWLFLFVWIYWWGN